MGTEQLPMAISPERIWAVLDEAFRSGRIVDAEKLLADELHRVLVRLQVSPPTKPSPADALAVPTRYAIQFALATRKAMWLDWVFQAHQLALAAVPAPVVDELHGVIRAIGYQATAVFARYLDTLRPRAAEMTPTERFALSRLDGLHRMLSKPSGRSPPRR
jgi:hypothetical protein